MVRGLFTSPRADTERHWLLRPILLSLFVVLGTFVQVDAQAGAESPLDLAVEVVEVSTCGVDNVSYLVTFDVKTRYRNVLDRPLAVAPETESVSATVLRQASEALGEPGAEFEFGGDSFMPEPAADALTFVTLQKSGEFEGKAGGAPGQRDIERVLVGSAPVVVAIDLAPVDIGECEP
jgi:hypothetical protein